MMIPARVVLLVVVDAVAILVFRPDSRVTRGEEDL